MTRFLPLCLIACPAFADGSQDTLTLTAESPVLGVIEYHNSAAKSSNSGDFDLKDGPILCTATIEIGDAETVTIVCQDGFVSDPQQADVPDGDTFHFVVVRVSS